MLLYYCVVHYVINNISVQLVLSLVRTRRAVTFNYLSVNQLVRNVCNRRTYIYFCRCIYPCLQFRNFNIIIINIAVAIQYITYN